MLQKLDRQIRDQGAELKILGVGTTGYAKDILKDVRARIAQGVGVILSVGLTRPWQKAGEEVERHWLQVNNIHLQDNPVWTERC